jgi:hypothetical protein
MMLVPLPPKRRLWSSRRSPTAIVRIVSRPDGGADVCVSIYTPGFPYRTVKDPTATAFFDDWMAAVARSLDGEWPTSGIRRDDEG